MFKKLALTALGALGILLLLFGGIAALGIYEIKNRPPSKAELEYRAYYEQQASKEYLTEEEYKELKRREQLMFQGKTASESE